MTVRLTLKFRANNQRIVTDYPNAVEARREVLRQSQRIAGGSWLQGTGHAGELVDINGTVHVDYSIVEVAA